MPTIKDIAEKSGVSISTVSRVLNGYPHIRPQVRENVLNIIKELNYQPNRVAQRLRSVKSNLVGVIIPDITNSFYTHAIRGIEHVLAPHDLSVMISNSDADKNRELNLFRLMRREEVAGLIVAPISEKPTPLLHESIARQLPIVVIDRKVQELKVDSVLVDNFKGAQLAINHLIDLGYRRIGTIGGPQFLSNARQRYEGYLHTLQEAQVTVEPDLVRFGNFRQDSGYVLANELIQLESPPSALFVANNLMTIGALNAIHQFGVTIPDDIALIGFDDMQWAESLNPPLTTIRQPAFDVGVQAADMFLQRIDQPEKPTQTIMLDVDLIVRESCGSKLVKGR